MVGWLGWDALWGLFLDRVSSIGGHTHSLRCPSRRSPLVPGANLLFYSIHMGKYKNSSGFWGAVDQALEMSPSDRDGVVQAGARIPRDVVSQSERRLRSVVESVVLTLS